MDDNGELGLQFSEGDSDISFSESLGKEYEMQVQELLVGSEYLMVGSDFESDESELSLKDWLEEKNQGNIETNHQQDVVQFDTVKDLEVDEKNELGMKPSKKIKFETASTSTIDSTDELPEFYFYGEETALAKVKGDSEEKRNNEE